MEIVDVEKPEELNVILGTTHFIKSVEDIYDALADSAPSIKFGLAFCEASGPRLIRKAGNDEGLVEIAVKNARAIGAGHTFFIAMKDAYPINVLPRLKQVPEVVNIFCATANPLQVVVAESQQGRGVAAVIDGGSPEGVESKKDETKRSKFLRDIGYKSH